MTVWLRSATALGLALAVAATPAAAQTDKAQSSGTPSSVSITLKLGTVDVRDLTFALPEGGTLSIGRIAFTGLVRNDDRARADRIDIEKMMLKSGTQTIEIPAIAISGADLPALLFRTITAGEPANNAVEFLTATRIDRIEIERVIQRDATAQVEAVHNGITISGVKDGIFASARIAGSTATAPDVSGMSEKIQAKSGEIRYQQFNFAEVARLFTGGGSGGAKPMLQRAVVDGFEIVTGQAVFRVKRAEMSDVEGRAPAQALPMSLKMQAGMAKLDPEQQKRVLASAGEILRFTRIGRYSLEGIEVSMLGISNLSIGAITLTGFSSQGIERFAISGFDLRFPGAPVRFDRFEIEGIKYGALIDAALDAANSGGPPDFSPARVAQLVPRLAAIRLSKLEAETPQGPVALGDLRFEITERDDGTDTSSAISGATIDLTKLDPNNGPDQLIALGYNQIVANAQARINWQRPTKALVVQTVALALDDVGRVELTARLDNVDADKAYADPAAADRIMNEARLGPIEIRIANLGFAERFYAEAAKGSGLSPEAMRAGLAAEMRAQAVGNFGPMLGPGSADAIATFLQSPGTITARIVPADGQSPPTVGELQAFGPSDVMQRLKVTLTAAPK